MNQETWTAVDRSLTELNPHVNHPRWRQATAQRIGESGRRPDPDV
jgi:hypothetical protein